MKKIISLTLALMLIFSLSVTAFAAGTNTITVTNALPGEVYTIFKMMDLVVGKNNGKESYSYKTTTEWESFFTGAGASYVTITNGYVTNLDETAAFAQAAANYAKTQYFLASKTCADGSNTVVFNGLDNGYYLVLSSLGTVAMTASTPSAQNATVKEKNHTDTITKLVQEDSTGLYGAENDAQIGDKVYYQSKVTLVKNTTKVSIVDTMEDGLTYNNDAVLSGGGITADDYICTGESRGFTITIKDEYINTLTTNVELTLTYSATLNSNAEVGTPEVNKIVIKYGQAQSVEAQTKTSTHKLTVKKYAEGIENLAGAVFKLKKNGTVLNLVKIDDTTYRIADSNDTATVDTFTTVASGPITINGLDSDNDYTLEEITAPVGYNKLSNEVEVQVNTDNSLYANVENKSGTELPTTGGIGTTIFYVLGATMVFGAAVLLVTKKRMSASK